MPFRALRFAEPDAAYWLLVLPLLWCCWVLQRWYRTRHRRASGIGWRSAGLAPLSGITRDLTVLTLVTVGGAALVIAAARPQALIGTPQYELFDLIVMLDRSASMLATDIQPSRLRRACIEIENFLRQKPAAIDRVGLIVFAGSPIVTAHLTRDLDILMFFLDWLQQDETPFYGTDLAMSLESALAMARTETPERRKVVVLLSDGEDRSERLERAIDDFHDSGIPIYAVGIGGDSAVTIPAPRTADDPTLRDDDGKELTTKFSEGTLRRVATMTNGNYFRSATGDELAATLTAVVMREQNPTQFRDEYHDVDVVALGAAALCLSALLVLL